MDKYIILQKGPIERMSKFTKRINEQHRLGYRVVNMSGPHGTYAVLMEKVS